MTTRPSIVSNDEPKRGRRAGPYFTILGIAFPLLGVWVAQSVPKSTHGSGGWGLGEVFLFMVAIGAGLALGALATGIALARRERLLPLQLALVLAYGVVFFSLFVNPALIEWATRDPGKPAYLALAAPPLRLKGDYVLLAAAAPEGRADTYRLDAIAQTDGTGMVKRLLPAISTQQPLGGGQTIVTLSVVDGHWALHRSGGILDKIPAAAWEHAEYAELRFGRGGNAIPVAVVDANRRRVER